MMNYREILQKVPRKEQSRYAKGLAIINSTAQTLLEQGLLPERFTMPIESESKVVSPESKGEASRHSLKQAIAEYRRGGRTPELWTSFWRAEFKIEGSKLAKLGFTGEIPDCDWTEEEIRRPMVDIQGNESEGTMIPYTSEIVLPILGLMYPRMQSRTVSQDSPVIDTHNTRGWIKVYSAVEAPNRNTGRSDAENFASGKGYLPGREGPYILASQASKKLNGRYSDEGSTWSWLPGSRIGEGLVNAHFPSDGGLHAYWLLDPGIPHQYDGWRFEEVKK